MTATRSTKTLTVLASAALIATSLLGGTADAKKKKKPKSPPPPPACAAYEPSEWSTDIPVTMLKDEHTADAPLEITVPTAEGVGTSSSTSPENSQDSMASHAFLNVQIDSAKPEVGLYGTLEFTPAWDYDLHIRGNDGVSLAYAAGTSHLINQFGLDGTGNGGHSGMGTENIDGLTTPDCTGYLVDVVGSITPGEDVTLKLWLGEAAYAPGS